MAEDKKKRFFQRFLKRYIIVVYNQGNFKERISLSLTPINLILVLSSLVVFTFFVSWLLFIYTPIKFTIPGFNNGSQNAGSVLLLQNRVDSFAKVARQDSVYIENLKSILKGDTGKTSMQGGDRKSIFRLAMYAENAPQPSYHVSAGQNNTNNRQVHLFPPVSGYISQHYNPEEDHYALDIVTEKDAPVKAMDDGMVVFAEWSTQTGNVIIVQHAGNLLSIYKHNSVLLKKVGTFVNQGDVIALVGNSGDLTTGPHLHFELWADGSPLDPENFISF